MMKWLCFFVQTQVALSTTRVDTKKTCSSNEGDPSANVSKLLQVHSVDSVVGGAPQDRSENPGQWLSDLFGQTVPCLPQRDTVPTLTDCQGMVNAARWAMTGSRGVLNPDYGKASEYKVLLSPDSAQTVWEHWGTTLSWWANALGDREDLADAIWTMRKVTLTNPRGQSWDLPGLGFNMVRYNLGGTTDDINRTVNGSKMKRSINIWPNKEIETIWVDSADRNPNSSSWNWTADYRQRKALELAAARGANRFELFAKSPAWWMTKSKNPAGPEKGAGIKLPGAPNEFIFVHEDNLLPEHMRDHAYHLAQVAKRAKDEWGITFTSVEAFNEPTLLGVWHDESRQEGCPYHRETMRKVVPLLREELDKAGLNDMPIAASDDMAVSFALESWRQWPNTTKDIIKYVNFHGYEGTGSPRETLSDEVKKVGKKKIYQSEFGGGEPTGIALATNLIMDIKLAKVEGWTIWQVLDAHESYSLFQISETWRSKDDTELVKATPMWNVMAHFSRHIRPGMTILNTFPTYAPMVAAWDESLQKLVLVAHAGHHYVHFRLPLMAFDPLSFPTVSVSMWKTNMGVDCKSDDDCQYEGCDLADGSVCHSDGTCYSKEPSDNCSNGTEKFTKVNGTETFCDGLGSMVLICPVKEGEERPAYNQTTFPTADIYFDGPGLSVHLAEGDLVTIEILGLRRVLGQPVLKPIQICNELQGHYSRLVVTTRAQGTFCFTAWEKDAGPVGTEVFCNSYDAKGNSVLSPHGTIPDEGTKGNSVTANSVFDEEEAGFCFMAFPEGHDGQDTIKYCHGKRSENGPSVLVQGEKLPKGADIEKFCFEAYHGHEEELGSIEKLQRSSSSMHTFIR